MRVIDLTLYPDVSVTVLTVQNDPELTAWALLHRVTVLELTVQPSEYPMLKISLAEDDVPLLHCVGVYGIH